MVIEMKLVKQIALLQARGFLAMYNSAVFNKDGVPMTKQEAQDFVSQYVIEYTAEYERQRGILFAEIFVTLQ